MAEAKAAALASVKLLALKLMEYNREVSTQGLSSKGLALRHVLYLFHRRVRFQGFREDHPVGVAHIITTEAVLCNYYCRRGM